METSLYVYVKFNLHYIQSILGQFNLYYIQSLLNQFNLYYKQVFIIVYLCYTLTAVFDRNFTDENLAGYTSKHLNCPLCIKYTGYILIG